MSEEVEGEEVGEGEKDLKELRDLFSKYRDLIDEETDTEIKTFKVSNTLRVESKRGIFICHRVFIENSGEEEIEKKFKTIRDGYKRIFSPEFRQDTTICENGFSFMHKYHRKLVGSLQEYFEFCLFYHYLKKKTVMTFEELKEFNSFLPTIHMMDYLCALFDLSGEMMRYAQNSAVQKRDYESTLSTCEFLQKMLTCVIGMSDRKWRKERNQIRRLKQVMTRSVRKVENHCMTIKIRQEEEIRSGFSSKSRVFENDKRDREFDSKSNDKYDERENLY